MHPHNLPSTASLRQFDCVVFDWDGTIMDSIVAIADSIQKAAQDLNLPVPSFRQASQVIGLGLLDALAQAIPEAKPNQLAAVSERYRHHYLTRDADLSLFPGVWRPYFQICVERVCSWLWRLEKVAWD
jgi:phosphoglycolate phosphatase